MILGENLRSLLTGDESVPLDMAALEVAQIEFPMLQSGPWLGVLDRHALEIDARAGQGADGASYLQAAHEYLFEDLGFRGNQQDYYTPLNSCLNHVLDTRLGIPISLSLIYMEIGRRLGRDVQGVSLPGHFLMLFRQGGFSVYLDAFHGGRFLTTDECRELAREITGVEVPENDPALLPASRRQIALRMLNNLRGIYIQKRTLLKALHVVDLLVVGDPTTSAWYKQRAAIEIELNQFRAAARDLERFLELDPAPDRQRIEEQIARLRRTHAITN